MERRINVLIIIIFFILIVMGIFIIPFVIKETPYVVSELRKQFIAPPEEKWALFNLIFTLSTIIISGALLFIKQDEKMKNEYNEGIYKYDKKDLRYFQQITVLIALTAAIFFAITEDITLKMQLIDKWTIVTFIIFIDQLFASIMIQRYARGRRRERQWREN